MNINKEVLTVLVNGAVYELFIILSMYVGFEILLDIKKKEKENLFCNFFD